MKRRIKNIAFITMAAVMGFGVVACKKGEVNAPGEVELFSTYITQNVIQDIAVEETQKLPAKFSFVAGKGEVEAAQLVMKAISNVGAYTFSVSDLKNANGDVFAKENFEIFNQKYIEVSSQTKGEYGEYGFYPDILMPFETSVEYGENNIKEGNNQAIIVQATIPTEQAAGVYTGKFTLTVDGKTHTVDVEMKIYDVTIPTTTGLESLYIITRENLAQGEGDDSLEMYKKYYDKLLEYKSMGYFLPASKDDAKGYAAAVREYYDKIANYAIPYSYNVSGNYYTLNIAGTWAYIEEILKLALEDGVNYLDKVANYYGVIDEPISNGTTGKCNTFCDSYNAGVIELANMVRSYGEEGSYSESQLALLENIAKSVEVMPNYVTAHYHETVKDHIVNYCPIFSGFDTEVSRGRYESVGGSDWFYGCTSPRSPYPTFHIDDADRLSSTQQLGWMASEYDVAGVLYWEVAYYVNAQSSDDHYVGTDCYDVANRCVNSNGEGFLFYPGAPYGIDGPVASNRLLSMRDGCDDYDLIQLLEKEYEKNGYNAQEALDILNRSLYNGTKAIRDNHAVLARARESVLNLVELAQKEGVFITKTTSTASGWLLTGIAPEGKEIKVNGNKIADGGEFNFELKLVANENIAALSCGDLVVNYVLNGVKTKVYGDDSSKKLSVLTTEQVSAETVSGDAIGYNGNVVKVAFTDMETPSFVMISSNFKEIIHQNVKDFIITIYNPTQTRFEMQIRMQGQRYDFTVTNVYLKPGMNEIHLEELSVLDWRTHKYMQNITFNLIGDGALSEVYICDAYKVEVK